MQTTDQFLFMVTNLFCHDDTAGMILLDPASPDLHPPVSAAGLKMRS